MWEFRNRNVFGATAFSTYGGFWIGLGLWAVLVKVPALTAAKPAALPATITALNHDAGWILLAFAVVNTYLLLLSTQITMAVFLVFLTLEITEIILFIGNFLLGSAATSGIIQAGGYAGLVTAVVAWYTSMAGISNGMAGARLRFPVGPPLLAVMNR
jgi:succinate-acetate transporter protein